MNGDDRRRVDNNREMWVMRKNEEVRRNIAIDRNYLKGGNTIYEDSDAVRSCGLNYDNNRLNELDVFTRYRVNTGVCRFTFKHEDYDLFSKIKEYLDKEEYTLETFDISTKVIEINPQHYTSWYFRRRAIEKLFLNDTRERRIWFLSGEMHFARKMCLRAPKCYQTWWHIRKVREWIGFEEEEFRFLNKCLELDSKNMYVWGHRSWLIRKYNINNRDMLRKELKFTTLFIARDCRNNSAWCYRNSLNLSLRRLNDLSESDLLSELDYVMYWLSYAPNNGSVWNYVISFFSKLLVPRKRRTKSLHGSICFELAPEGFKRLINSIFSKFKYNCYQVVYIKACIEYELGNYGFVIKAFRFLQVIDCIRKKYWKWREDCLLSQINNIKQV
ncbi:farnesyltransferase [Cryptosporidium ryanae]|uniref:farnesyltransferase n=1 Tax=Cryptosporidium ryanae TaxID=515981 RepID=UPI00351AAC68|nr:farnesyltransferase [Cryptosporidium ryanae]